MFKVKAIIKRRKSILDPQGKAAEQGAKLLGLNGVNSVRVDKMIDFMINSNDSDEAGKIADEFCVKLLSNPIMEDYEFTLEKVNES
ncbi:MAG: phosphoribosylformylglycinamidine synthase subunit PurS [Ignavibacteriaceae bacterium]|nr:phosphoribosylformylglycinamidine synthase subunit PurS [Ignavibacteriaceae bacterium]